MHQRACAVILAGGQGSRLKPFTTVLPKPLIPIDDVPISEIVVHQLREAGFRKIILAVNRHEGLLRSYFGDGERFGLEITYSRETTPLGTAGPLYLMRDRLPEFFLVMNGDLLTDLDYGTLLVQHAASKCDLTVATYRRTQQIADGVIDIDEGGGITSFREKPTHQFWISMGIYACRRSILDLIPDGQPMGMDDVILSMLRAGSSVNTHRHDGAWYDIGCPHSLERATEAFSEHRSRFLPQREAELETVS